MDTSKKIIRGAVNGRGFTTTSAITQWDYGWIFIPDIESMPPTYRLDFSNEEKNGAALPVFCDSEGAEVPKELIDTGKDIHVWYVCIGDGYGITEYHWKIPNKCKSKTEAEALKEFFRQAGQAVDTTHLTDSVTVLTKEGFELRHEVFLHEAPVPELEDVTEE